MSRRTGHRTRRGRPPAPRQKPAPSSLSATISYTLDRFSIDDLRAWHRGSRAIEEYQLRVFHELEAQRQLYRKELFSTLREARLSITLYLDRWVRLVDHRYSNQPLSAIGSIRSIGGRFNMGVQLADPPPSQETITEMSSSTWQKPINPVGLFKAESRLLS